MLQNMPLLLCVCLNDSSPLLLCALDRLFEIYEILKELLPLKLYAKFHILVKEII